MTPTLSKHWAASLSQALTKWPPWGPPPSLPVDAEERSEVIAGPVDQGSVSTKVNSVERGDEFLDLFQH